jgi:hypothetical protein
MAMRGICAGVFVLLIGAADVFAQRAQNVPPGECTNCHDHDKQKEWAETRDGDGKGKQHFRAYQQLFEPKAAEYAEAIGLAKVNDVKGTCVTCHATLVQGRAKNGVTCQSCHGAGSLYLKPHQEKGAYKASLALGLKDVVKNPQGWVGDCLTCHVMGANGDLDAKIVKAGHPDGSDFIIGSKLQFVSGPGHWTSKYTANEINALGGPIKTRLLARLKGGTKAAQPDPPPPPVKPQPTDKEPDAPAAPKPGATTGSTTPNTGSTTPVTPLQPNPEPVVTPPRTATNTPTESPRRPAPPPLPPSAPPVPPPTVKPETPTPELPMTPAGVVAALQGRIASLLDRLLAGGVTIPKPVTPPPSTTTYRGADAELIRLQDEIIALALDALASPPAKPAPKQ